MIQRKHEPPDPAEHDAVVAQALRALDPSAEDPGYWFRFYGRVMSSIRRELARRRMLADLSMSDVVAGWARTVVPTALMVAAMAVFVLLRPAQTVGPPLVGVEELLTSGPDGVAVPAVVTGEFFADASVFMMASGEF